MNTPAKCHSIARFVFALSATVIAGVTLAAPHTASAEQAGRSVSQSAQYLPSIADLMIATIQPRHRRLWQAGIGLAHPTTNNISFPEMITSVTKQPFVFGWPLAVR